MNADKKKINVKEHMSENLIDLSLTGISEVPVKDIAALRRATILDLSSNSIIGLGKTFATLTHIAQLDLSKNQIKVLPEDFGKLINLRHLDLYNNKIVHLPLSFGSLKKLRYLDLKGNPLVPALQNVVGPCLTNKECSDASKKTVAFMADLDVQLKEEKRKTDEKKRLREAAEAEKAKKEEAAKKKAVKKEKTTRTKKQANLETNSAEQVVVASGQKHNVSLKTSPREHIDTKNTGASCSRTVYLILLTLAIFYIVVYNAAAFNFLTQYLKPEDVEGITYRREIIKKYLSGHYENLLSKFSAITK